LTAAGRTQGVAKVVIVVELGDVHAAALIDSGLADALLVKPVLARDLEAAIAPSLDTHEGPAPTRAAREVDTGAFAGVHVLAADDVATNREVLSEALSRLGVKVTLVEDGQAAVRLAGRRRFDLILMDCSMPVMDGYQATRAIRDEETRSGLGPVPIVALTAHVAGAHANAWREAGMTATLSKPFTLASLRTCLERALGPRPAPESHSDAPLATEVSGVAASPLPPASLAGLAPPAAADPATAPVLDQAVLADILEMQAAGDDLVGRIADLYRLHAPPAMERLQRALETGDGVRIAETAHALKSLCRNIGAVRLGDVLHEVEGSARQGDVGGAHAAAARLDGQLDLVLDELARFAPGPEAARRAVAGG